MRSFPGVQALLELGAGVAEVEALLADGVVAVEADEQDAARRVDGLPGLQGETGGGAQKQVCLTSDRL